LCRNLPSAEKTKECKKRKQQLIRAAGEAPGYSARASLPIAVRISKTKFKQYGFERDIAGCSISFLLQKNETKFFPVAY
jgi:hypothetical protein